MKSKTKLGDVRDGYYLSLSENKKAVRYQMQRKDKKTAVITSLRSGKTFVYPLSKIVYGVADCP